MKKTFLLGLLLLASSGLGIGQTASPSSAALPDLIKYGKALEAAAILTPNKVMPLRKIDGSSTTITMASFKGPSKTVGGCAYTSADLEKYRTGGIWVFLPDELREIMAARQGEFKEPGLRLKELLGLNPTYTYECVLVVTLTAKDLVRPSLVPGIEQTTSDFVKGWGGDFPFTGLGYTCDWYYGDGCRYGMSEFYIRPGLAWGETKSCTLDEYLKSGCKTGT